MKFVSSISSLPISAQSAAFAPTNSADVSAIASAYQVVSATATQLYAGTAYVTSVNGAPLSASRAGNAANASLATSAWYDGTGRLISSLPDSAAVSAIASAYAESAASGKQDELTFSYDENDRIDGINGSALAGQGGGGGSVASPSGTIIVTDGTAIEATNSAIRVIPSTAVTGSGSTYGTTLYTDYATLIYGNLFDVYGLGLQYYSSTSDREIRLDLNTVSGAITYNIYAPSGSTSAGVLFSSVIDTAYTVSATPTPETVFLSGDNPLLLLKPGSPISTVDVLAWASNIPAPVRFNVSGGYVNTINDSSISAYTAYMAYTSDNASLANLAYTARYDSDGRPLSAMAMQSALPTGVVSHNATLVCQGFSAEATNSAVVTELLPGYEPVAVYTGGESLSPYSPVVATPPSANPKSVLSVSLYYGNESTISAVFDGQTATANVGAFPETVTFAVPNATSVELYCSTYRNLSGNISASASDDPIVTGVGELAWASALPTYEYDAEDKISAINGSAIAGGGGGIDSATCSAIASAYAESAAASKLDTTAFNSGDFYTTANPSGFIDSAYVDSAVSGKADSSALSSYALSADVSGTVDLVSSQSANWGGSALALSAGPGVKLEKVGNTLVIKADETLLWSGANTSAATLSEPYSNFERIDAVLGFPGQGKTHHIFEAASATQLMYAFGQTNAYWCDIKCTITDGTAFKVNDAKYVTTPYGTSTQVGTDTGNVASAKNCLVKIYGINRTAEA